MSDKPFLLDLFCGAGGATKGYQRAGFTVHGVDIKPQPHYCGDKFIQADALAYVAQYGWMFDAIHASPPCQHYSTITRTAKTQNEHLDLIPQTRFWLEAIGVPYVIENVPGARKALRNPLTLCGTTFGMYIERHRLFESNVFLFDAGTCNHWLPTVKHGRKPVRYEQFPAPTGNYYDVNYVRFAMGIEWMTHRELKQAILPVYTEFVGRQLMIYVLARKE